MYLYIYITGGITHLLSGAHTPKYPAIVVSLFPHVLRLPNHDQEMIQTSP